MTWTTIVLIGVGLSVDAFGVTVANALTAKDIPWYRLMSMPLAFGIFQALMPLLGYYSGGLLRQFIGAYGDVITALVLGAIGVLMLKDAFLPGEEEKAPLHLTLHMLLIQAIATSIDAFVVGIGFGLSNSTAISAVWLIGLTTFIISTIGLVVGRFFGEKFGRPANIFGGLLLLYIAIQSLL